MKKSLPLLFLCGFLLAACGSDTPSLSPLSPDAKILAFGDSLTHGYGVQQHESYPAILATLSGREVINAGVSGEESTPGLNRLATALAQYDPQLLILCHGGNDILRKRNLDKMESNLRAMIQLAQARNIPVVLLGVPRPGLFLSSYEGYQRVAESTGVIYIDDLVAEVLGDNGLKSDTVHPNKKGYRVMAETIHMVLKDNGAI